MKSFVPTSKKWACFAKIIVNEKVVYLLSTKDGYICHNISRTIMLFCILCTLDHTFGQCVLPNAGERTQPFGFARNIIRLSFQCVRRETRCLCSCLESISPALKVFFRCNLLNICLVYLHVEVGLSFEVGLRPDQATKPNLQE